MDAAAVCRIPRIIFDCIGPSFDPFSLIFRQVEALFLLDRIVFLINLVKFRRDDHFCNLNRIFIEAPSELRQECNALLRIFRLDILPAGGDVLREAWRAQAGRRAEPE